MKVIHDCYEFDLTDCKVLKDLVIGRSASIIASVEGIKRDMESYSQHIMDRNFDKAATAFNSAYLKLSSAASGTNIIIQSIVAESTGENKELLKFSKIKPNITG